MKRARKVTGRQGVLHCAGGFHGMTLGGAVSHRQQEERQGARVTLGNSYPILTTMPQTSGTRVKIAVEVGRATLIL